jgi:excisionase family DNA binding protein
MISPVEKDPVSAALKFSIGRAKLRGQAEVTADDLLLGCLHSVSRFGAVELGGCLIDLEEFGIDWTAAQPKSDAKLSYSLPVVEILDRAAMLSKMEGAGKIAIEHLLVCFHQETGGVMGKLRERYGIDSLRWRVAVAKLGTAPEVETAVETVSSPRTPAPAREYLSPEEAAELLGVHVQTLRGYIRSGKLRALRVAGERVIRIHRGSLESLLEPLTLEPAS